jgi:hypothetical protein
MFTSISMKSLITSITTERTGARSRQAVGCHPVTAPLCGEAPAPAAPGDAAQRGLEALSPRMWTGRRLPPAFHLLS